MSDHTFAEIDELRCQIARLEAEHRRSQVELRGQDDSLGLLLLLLAVDRGIYAVRKPDSSEWELLSREQYKLRRGEKLPESKSLKMPVAPRKRAA
jgi:hypothetical protein